MNEKFIRLLKTIDIKLLVLDNIASLASGIDENSKKDWDPINQWLLDLRFAGITTVILHHTGKTGTQRGTSAHEDNVDISIVLRRPPDYQEDEGARFVVEFKKTRVSTSELPTITGFEFKLIESGDRVEWVYTNIRARNKLDILAMLGEKMKQNEIAAMFDVTPQYISILKKEFKKDNLLKEKGKLTKSGYEAIDRAGENG